MHLSPSYGEIILYADADADVDAVFFCVGLDDSVAEKFAKTVLGLRAKKMNKMWLTTVCGAPFDIDPDAGRCKVGAEQGGRFPARMKNRS